MYFVATLGILAMTLWLIVFRFTGRPESNWPLVYYFLVVNHLKLWEYGSFMPNYVWAAAAVALFMRFEFMGRGFIKVFVFMELPFLLYAAYRCVELIPLAY